jgi:energy-coupling factor transporter ATP-binding protein EcfA2
VTKVTQDQELPVRIRDVGGIHEAEFTLRPGVNQFTGPNGAGKTTAINAIARATGGKTPLEPRDGAREGSVEVDGVSLKVRGVVKADGRARVQVCDGAPLGDLIDPGLKDPVRAAEARIRALLKLCPMPLTPDVVATLAGGNEVAALVQQEVNEGAVSDLLGLAERCRVVGNRLALEAEKEGQKLRGVASAHHSWLETLRAELGLEGGGEPSAPVLSIEQARARVEDATRKFEVTRVTASQRSELEARQREVRATMGEKPDPRRFDTDLQLRQDALVAHERRVAELERLLSFEREAMAGVKADYRNLIESQRVENQALSTWQRNAAILEQPVEGPTAAEVEEAAAALAAAKTAEISTGVLTNYFAQLEGYRAKSEEAHVAELRSEVLRTAAQSVSERVGLVLQGTEAAGLTVFNGRLAVLDGGNVLDFEMRQSEGQRIAAALRVASRAYRDKVVPLPGVYWNALDADNQREFARLARQMGLYVITEQPGDGELHLHHVEEAVAAGAVA